MESLPERLRASLRTAIASRDHIAAAALRSAISAIDNAQAVDHVVDRSGGRPVSKLGAGASEVARRELSEHELTEIVRREIEDRITASLEYERRGRAAEAATLRSEASVLSSQLDNPS